MSDGVKSDTLISQRMMNVGRIRHIDVLSGMHTIFSKKNFYEYVHFWSSYDFLKTKTEIGHFLTNIYAGKCSKPLFARWFGEFIGALSGKVGYSKYFFNEYDHFWSSMIF